MIAVLMMPGQSATTRIARRSQLASSDWLIPTTPNFEAQYGVHPCDGNQARLEAVCDDNRRVALPDATAGRMPARRRRRRARFTPDHPLPVLDGRRLDITAVADAGVIVQDVEAAVSSEHHLGERLEIVGRVTSTVLLSRRRDLGRDGGGRIGIDISGRAPLHRVVQQPCRGPP